MNDPLKVRPKTLRPLLADPPRSHYPKKECKLTWTEGRGRRTINQRLVIKMTRKQLEYEINVTASTTATALVEQSMYKDITTATTRELDEVVETVRNHRRHEIIRAHLGTLKHQDTASATPNGSNTRLDVIIVNTTTAPDESSPLYCAGQMGHLYTSRKMLNYDGR